VRRETFEWADGFNNRRLPEPIGNTPPAEAEAACRMKTWTHPIWSR